MEYYYALLENYNQLKRRKFKLSLREGDEVEAGGEEAKNIQKIVSTAGEADSIETAAGPFPGTEIRLYKTKTGSIMAGDTVNKGSTNQVQWVAIVDADGQRGKQPTANKYWGIMFGGEEAKPFKKKGAPETPPGDAGGGSEETDEFTPEEETLAIAEKLQGLINGDEEKDGLLTKDEDGNIADEQPFFPGYIPNQQHSRLQKIINSIFKKGKEEEQGLGVTGAAAENPTIVDKLYNSPDIDPEKALTALKSYAKATETISSLRGWDGKGDLPKEITAKALGELSDSIKVTPNGVTFDGIYMSYRQNANRTNDIATNMAEQIAKAIDHHNKNCPDKDSEGYTACYIKPIKAPKVSEGKDINFARRGTLVEHAAVLADLGLMADMENCEGDTRSGPAKGRMNCDEVVALADAKIAEILADKTTAEEARKMFAKGLCAMGQQCLVDIDSDLGDAKMTELAIKYLTSDPPNGEGWTEEQAAFVLSRVTQPGQDGTKALVILVASTRGFGKVYGSLDIVDSTVEGKVGSDLPGQKTDNKKIATKKSAAKWTAEMKENEKGTPAEALEKLSECTGEGMGWDNLARPVDPEVSEAAEEGEDTSDDNVQIDVEIKTHTNIRSGRTKMGEGLSSAMSKECDRDSEVEKEKDKELADAAAGGDEEAIAKVERRKMERDFYEANDRRLDACSKAHEEALGEAPWGKHTEGDKKGEAKTMKEAACEMQGKLDARLAVTHGLLSGSKPSDPDGLLIEDSGQAIITSWLRARGGDAANTKNQERGKAANRALAALQGNGTPNPKDQEELDKVKEDIEIAELSRLLGEGREAANFDPENPEYDKSKPMSAEAKAYLLFRMSRDGGSLHECAKDVRGMGTEEVEAGKEKQEEKLGGVEQVMGCINAGIYGMIAGVMGGDLSLEGGISGGGQRTASWSIRDGKKPLGGVSFERKPSGVTAVTTVGMAALSDTSAVRERNRDVHSKEEDLLTQFLQGQQALLEKLIDQTT
jgi:hypothetical protein